MLQLSNYIESAEIISCGTELLMGQIVNTNAAFFAKELRMLGIDSQYQTTCGDNPERLAACLRQSLSRSDCVILSGGLGPTADDISMAVAAQVAGLPLVFRSEEYALIEAYFARIGRVCAANNKKQAMLPEQAELIPNRNGTAPGAIIPLHWEGRDRAIVLLPGPPNENKDMFRDTLRPFLKAHTESHLRNYFVRMIGIGESDAESRLRDLIDRQENPTLAPYCSDGEVMFRITQKYKDEHDENLALPLLHEVMARLGSYVYEIGMRSMPEVVVDLLLKNKLTVSLAESCTAGLMAAMMGEIAGVSPCFKGAIVSYSNEAKQDLLAVPADTLNQYGAVSAETAMAMAQGCRARLGTDYACAITGIAGPDGGSSEKAVGTVFLALDSADGSQYQKLQLTGKRQKIQYVAALRMFDMLRVHILKRYPEDVVEGEII